MRYKRQYKGPRSTNGPKMDRTEDRTPSSPEGEDRQAAGLTPSERFVSAFVQVLTGGILIFIFLWIVWLA